MDGARREIFMQRALELAKLAKANVGTNPNVGAVLVHNNRIIGEGYYEKYGGSHAEVNAINSVSEGEKEHIPDSTLFVTLEPCNFYGKTPPCSEFILKNKIKNLVIGCEDPNPKIAGSSLSYLRQKGVHITSGILDSDCKSLIAPFRTNVLHLRPYITIKFAQSKDFYMSKKGEQTWLSNSYSKLFSHKLRSENHAILIGTETARIDDPELTNRLHPGNSPLRIVLDRSNKLKDSLKLISDDKETLIISEELRQNLDHPLKEQWLIPFDDELINTLIARLFSEKKIARMIIEGGAFTIKKFLDSGLWDQAAVIQTNKVLSSGIKAPNVVGRKQSEYDLAGDKVTIIQRIGN